MTDQPAVRLHRATWTYALGSAPALREVSLSIEPGEMVLLVGPSGSGKSTALRLMNGLIPHLHDGVLTGSAHLHGVDVTTTDLADLGRLAGSVWQHPFRQFFASLVGDEVAFAMENHGVEPGQIRARVADLLASRGLLGLWDRRLETLSSGQQQGVAVLSALAHRPPVLLLDEPSANLSDQGTADLLDSLSRLRAEAVTTVVVEHRLDPFIPLADRVVCFRGGGIAAQWTRAEFTELTDADLVDHGLRPRSLAPSLPREPGGPRAEPATAPAGSTSGGAGITVQGVRSVRGGALVLDLERAHLLVGRVTAIRGANGAGKTTLARVLAGLQRHHGTVSWRGHASSRADRRRRTTFIGQEVQRQLFADSVRGELDLAAGRGTSTDEMTALLTRLDLAQLADRHPLSLSGGQQQRLAIAVAAVSDRPVIVLDEPSTGVDARHLTTISDLLRGLAADGRCVVVISHDDDLLALAADAELVLTPPHRRVHPRGASGRVRRGASALP